jgi:hypothetical protein
MLLELLLLLLLLLVLFSSIGVVFWYFDISGWIQDMSTNVSTAGNASLFDSHSSSSSAYSWNMKITGTLILTSFISIDFSSQLRHTTDATSQRCIKLWIKNSVFTQRDMAPQHGNFETVITSKWKLWCKERICSRHRWH